MNINLSQQSHFSFRQAFQFRDANQGQQASGDVVVQESYHQRQRHSDNGSVVQFRSSSSYSSQITYSKPTAAVGPVESLQAPAEGAVLASDTILKFIETRLLQEQAEGATPEEMASRIEAGLEGFESGFKQAEKLLAGIEGMTEQVRGEIGQTRELVLEGIDSLRERFLGAADTLDDSPVAAEDAQVVVEGSPVVVEDSPVVVEDSPVVVEDSPVRVDATPVRVDDSPVTAADSPVNVAEEVTPLQPASMADPAAPVSSIFSRSEMGGKNSFSFQLTTVDGDKVRIQASSLRASIMEAYLSPDDSGAGNTAASQTDRFSLKVRGELDEGELTAIKDLLSQVADLADQFFEGDVEQAYAMATELGYDNSEISKFALHLKHTSVQRMSNAYEQSAPADSAGSASSASGSLRPLSDYVANLIEAYNTASLFQQPLQLLEGLAANLSVGESSAFSESMKMSMRG